MVQPVEYEKIQKYCSKCLKQGHDIVECKFEEGNRKICEIARRGERNQAPIGGDKVNLGGDKNIVQVYRPVHAVPLFEQDQKGEGVSHVDLLKRQEIKEGKQMIHVMIYRGSLLMEISLSHLKIWQIVVQFRLVQMLMQV